MMRALIYGVSGQDGFYLTNYLLSLNYKIYGVTRDLKSSRIKRFLDFYELQMQSEDVKIIEQKTNSYIKTTMLINDIKPDEIYYLAGQSDINMSFESSEETFRSFVEPFEHIVKATAITNPKIKIFNPMSSDCFTDIGNSTITLNTALNDNSPYSKSKNYIYKLSKQYAKKNGLLIKQAFLFNLESKLREGKYVLKKICNYFLEERYNKKEKLILGNIDIVRNWGLSEEFVIGFHLLMSSDENETIICSPENYSIRQLLEYTFSKFNLDYREYISISDDYLRKSDIKYRLADTSDIEQKLEWSPKCDALCTIDHILFDKNLFVES